jgi:hypothetical protein
MHLLHTLGELPVWWHHWEPNAQEEIAALSKANHRDLVFVQTYRDPESLRASHVKRDPENGDEFYLTCNRIYESSWHLFPCVTIGIEASDALKTAAVFHIFKLMRQSIPPAALTFMESWRRINSIEDADKSIERELKQTLTSRRIKSERLAEIIKEGENDGT